MIAKIEDSSGKVGEIFHKGNVFSIKIFDEKSLKGEFLKEFLDKLKKEVRTVSDFEFSPPSFAPCKLGRSEKETFLILSSGIPSFEISFTNPPFEINSGKDVF